MQNPIFFKGYPFTCLLFDRKLHKAVSIFTSHAGVYLLFSHLIYFININLELDSL